MQENEYKRYEELGNWDFSKIKYTTEQESSWHFYDKIAEYAKPDSLILDLGTGGGEKILRNMPNCAMIIATDFSPNMIKTANENKKMYTNKNIKFVVMNNLNMTFPKDLFDIVTARHTIIDAKQIYNCLNSTGVLIVKGVDKYDCWELKEIFGRGQAFDNQIAISKRDYEDIKNAGFSEIDLQEIIQYEYFETENDLMALLLKTPIIEDFSNFNYSNRIIEKDLLNKYIKSHTTQKGIELKRVLYGIVAKK